MKNFFLSLALLFITVTPAQAQMGMMSQDFDPANIPPSSSLEDLTNQLLADQNVTSLTDLDCSRLDEGQLETLGDAVMGLMHPNAEVHEAMDTMMGGDGSDSLRLAHINMAQNYLGCNSFGGYMMGDRTGNRPLMGMMDYAPNNNWGTTFKNMHRFEGGNALWNLHLILMTITWGSVTALLIALTRYYWKKGK